MSDSTIAFLGLGIMGNPMALNLQKAGFEVKGFNRSEAGRERYRAAGGTPVPTLREAVTGADVVITMLPDSPDVDAVYRGAEGVLEHAGAGTLLIDMSTISPETARLVADESAGRGFRMIDAPVSGGDQGARDGTLSVMVGGEAADVERAHPVLAAMSSSVRHVGPNGAGQALKAANQMVVAGNIAVLAEAITLAEASGIDPGDAFEVFAGGMAGSTVLTRKKDAMLAHEFAPGFRLTLHEKDLNIAANAARAKGVVAPVAAQVHQLVLQALACGDGELDHSALLRRIWAISGRSL